MTEKLQAAAIGFALVDEKLINNASELPAPNYEEAERFLLKQKDVHRSAGGSVANTMVAFGESSGYTTRLYYKIADDQRGNVFYKETGADLGEPQVSEEGYTGFCVISLNSMGEIVDEITLYGVAQDVEIPRGEISDTTNHLVVANFNSLRIPRVMERVDELLKKTLDRKRGLFAFRLSGAHASMADQEDVTTVINSLPRIPEVVFANDHEVKSLIGNDRLMDIGDVLPDTRLLVVTRSCKDLIVRFEDTITTIPAGSVKNVVDVTGAGDQLMGVTLARLLEKSYGDWTMKHVQRAVSLGTRAAAEIVQMTYSRKG